MIDLILSDPTIPGSSTCDPSHNFRQRWTRRRTARRRATRSSRRKAAERERRTRRTRTESSRPERRGRTWTSLLPRNATSAPSVPSCSHTSPRSTITRRYDIIDSRLAFNVSLKIWISAFTMIEGYLINLV